MFWGLMWGWVRSGRGGVCLRTGRSIMVKGNVINFGSGRVGTRTLGRDQLLSRFAEPIGWEGGDIDCIMYHSPILGTKYHDRELERSAFLRGCTIFLKYSTPSPPTKSMPAARHYV